MKEFIKYSKIGLIAIVLLSLQFILIPYLISYESDFLAVLGIVCEVLLLSLVIVLIKEIINKHKN